MSKSEQIISDTLLELENGKEFSEDDSLIRLLEISSAQAYEGKTLSAEELIESLRDKFK